MLKLILHNVLKHKFLFILIGLMVILLCFYLLVGINTVFSVAGSLKKAVSENMTGDLIITSSLVKRIDVINKDGEKELIPLENWKELLAYLRSRPEVANASPRLRVWSFVQSDRNEAPMIIVGVDPESEPGLLPERSLDDGEWITSSNEIQMYYRHSDLLSAAVGDELGITIPTLDGYPNYDIVTLKGIFDYSDLAYYTEFAFYGLVTLDYLNELLMGEEEIAGEINIRLNEGASLKGLEKDIEARFPGVYKFILPENSANLINGIYKLVFFTVFFVAFLLMLMVYLCSSFLVNLSIETRRQEIGVYMALGVKKWRISMLFGGEFLIMMIFSGVMGILLGLYAMWGISTNGIEATIVPLHLVFGRSILFIHNDLRSFIIIAGVLFLAFAGSTVNAILRMAKLDPVEIMREI